MLIGLEGGLGSGKTIMLVRYLKRDSEKGHKILTNFGTKNFKTGSLDVQELLVYSKEGIELNNITIGLDELTVFVDCRVSMSKANRIFSYFVLQSRKRNVNIYYTTQDMRMIDKRIVNHTPIVIYCEKLYRNNVEVDGYRKYKIYDFRNPRQPVVSRFIMNIKPYYDYYDTNEVIKPLEL